MDFTRRKMIATSALSFAASTAGCLSLQESVAGLGGSDHEPRVKFSGNVSTEEPLIENVEISTKSLYPHHYSALITSKDEEESKIRWKYIREDKPMLVGDLDGTNFEAESLVFFGMQLPATKQLQSKSTSLDDGTLYAEYRIEQRSSAADDVLINTHIKRVESDKRPDDLEVRVQF